MASETVTIDCPDCTDHRGLALDPATHPDTGLCATCAGAAVLQTTPKDKAALEARAKPVEMPPNIAGGDVCPKCYGSGDTGPDGPGMCPECFGIGYVAEDKK
ncbi:MAG: hypothetical protein ABIW84_00110 [Ilumatobacteraceae bacterium]